MPLPMASTSRPVTLRPGGDGFGFRFLGGFWSWFRCCLWRRLQSEFLRRLCRWFRRPSRCCRRCWCRRWLGRGRGCWGLCLRHRLRVFYPGSIPGVGMPLVKERAQPYLVFHAVFESGERDGGSRWVAIAVRTAPRWIVFAALGPYNAVVGRTGGVGACQETVNWPGASLLITSALISCSLGADETAGLEALGYGPNPGTAQA